MPYATVQHRVSELERAKIVEVESAVDEASKRAIKIVRLLNFRIDLTPRVIHRLVTGRHREEFVVS